MEDYLRIISHDAFRFGGGLNKSSAEVYWWLLQGSMSVDQLITKTGRSKRTIYRVLSRMAGLVDKWSGELVPMVESKNGFWYANLDVDLDRISLIIGTAGIGKWKERQYKLEQIKHRRELQAGWGKKD